MKKYFATLLMALIFLLISTTVFGHARLKMPTPRNNSDSLKVGPCGNVAKGNSPSEFQAGSTINVTWEETINHPGRFYISFSTNDMGFENMRLAEVADNQNGNVMQNNPATYHQFSAQVTLPNFDCDNCTLQLIQSMEENPNAPTFYYSCADVRLTGSGNTIPPPEDPPPNPSPDDQNNGGNNAQGTDNSAAGQNRQAPKMGGCGTVSNHSNHSGPGSGPGLAALLLLFMPIVFVRKLKTVTNRRR